MFCTEWGAGGRQHGARQQTAQQAEADGSSGGRTFLTFKGRVALEQKKLYTQDIYQFYQHIHV